MFGASHILKQHRNYSYIFIHSFISLFKTWKQVHMATFYLSPFVCFDTGERSSRSVGGDE
jgi:hypothetical protein